MSETPLYPLRFTPIFQYRLWGGQRLASWLKRPSSSDGPIGEAWLLSDRDDCASCVSEGPLQGYSITRLLEHEPQRILGLLAARHKRLPLLLKFLDVKAMLSVQVHPQDSKAELIPVGETGKTEAWVVLDADPCSRIYAGLKAGVTEADLRSLSATTVDKCLASFRPIAGQCILIEAGAVHSLGDGVLVLEVQQNSDVTFRLFDWNHVDPKTGRKRMLQVDQAIACVNFAHNAITPIEPLREGASPGRDRLFDCSCFQVWRRTTATPFRVGAVGEMRALVCLDGSGAIEYNGGEFGIEKGDVMLLPAIVGICRFRPAQLVTLLEIAVPVAS